MSQHFYDGQIKRYLTQFMRLMSNFSYKDGKGRIVQIPVRFGDMNRQVAQILNKNSENVVQSAPFIACYIKGLDFARDRLQDPSYVSKINVRERAWDDRETINDGYGNIIPNPNFNREYLNTQGANYTIERLMPTPFNLQFTTDIWTTNVDQKLQILEQMLVLFNPSMEIQTNSNFVDWTSLSLVELTNLVYSSRSVPQGLEQDIDIATLNFTSPIWLTTPAKVKKLGVITKIITSIFDDAQGDIVSSYDEAGGAEYFTGRDAVSVSVTTLGNLGLLVLDGRARLIPPGTDGSVGVNWYSILDQYPGKFTADLSMIYTQSPDDGREMYGRIALDPDDETVMHVSWDSELRPNDYNITAIIDPTTYNPGTPTGPVKYLILEDINTNIAAGDDDWRRDPRNTSYVPPRYSSTGTLISPEILGDAYDGPDAWKQPDQSDFQARANDIIEWTGTEWQVLFESQAATSTVYITNQTTGIQYTWTGQEWLKSFEGLYTQGQWRLVL
jgi:hypothetical protein